MKKAMIILLAACLLLSAAGCTIPIESVSKPTETVSKPAEAIFTIDSYQLQITADSTFQDKTAGSYDLQLTNGRTYIGIMAFKYIDLPTGVTPLDVLDMQNEDLFSKRTNVTTVEEAKTQSLPQGTVTHALFSGEKDGNKNYYASYLIDMPDAQTFAWVLVSGMPSYITENREYLNTIVCSLMPIQ